MASPDGLGVRDMHRFNIRSVDLNLLPVFEAVYEERSLSRAAVRLAMTQSAISHALNRLRAVFRDELFVRQSRGVTPTPAAGRIYPKVREALTSVRESVTDTRTFDPKTSERRFVMSIPHPLGPLIELRLQERMTIAPKIAISAEHPLPSHGRGRRPARRTRGCGDRLDRARGQLQF